MSEVEILRRSIAANETKINTLNTLTMVGIFMACTLAVPAVVAGGFGVLLGGAALGLSAAGIGAVALLTLAAGAGVFSFLTNAKNAGLRSELAAEEKTSSLPAVHPPAPAKTFSETPEPERKTDWAQGVLAGRQAEATVSR